jgi:hypothetical protein
LFLDDEVEPEMDNEKEETFEEEVIITKKGKKKSSNLINFEFDTGEVSN